MPDFNIFYVYTSRLLFRCQGIVKAHDEDGVIKNTSSESGSSVVKNLPDSAGGMRWIPGIGRVRMQRSN